MAGKTYTKADDGVMSVVRYVLTHHHQHLVDLELRVGVILVESDGDEPAIKCHGSAAAAKIARVPLKRRLFMPFDVLIEVDQSVWGALSKDQQRALFDHELTHVVPKRNRGGLIDLDVDGRPKLVLKPDDWVLTGFRDVVEHWGSAALEAQAIASVLASPRSDGAQGLFDFLVPRAAQPQTARGCTRGAHAGVA